MTIIHTVRENSLRDSARFRLASQGNLPCDPSSISTTGTPCQGRGDPSHPPQVRQVAQEDTPHPEHADEVVLSAPADGSIDERSEEDAGKLRWNVDVPPTLHTTGVNHHSAQLHRLPQVTARVHHPGPTGKHPGHSSGPPPTGRIDARSNSARRHLPRIPRHRTSQSSSVSPWSVSTRSTAMNVSPGTRWPTVRDPSAMPIHPGTAGSKSSILAPGPKWVIS